MPVANPSAAQALAAIRCGLAALLFIHGAARATVGGVVPFGAFLEAQGLPFGLGIAWFVTGFELAADRAGVLGDLRLRHLAGARACGLVRGRAGPQRHGVQCADPAVPARQRVGAPRAMARTVSL